MKISGEISTGFAALVQAHGTVLQQLRVHKNICILWNYEKLGAAITKQLDLVSLQFDEIIFQMLKAEMSLDLQNLNKINIGQTVEEILMSDKEMAQGCCKLAERVHALVFHQVHVRTLLERVILQQTDYFEFLSQQLELARQMGTQLYLATRC